MERGEVSM